MKKLEKVPEDDLAQEVTDDLAQTKKKNFNKIAPFGKEDTVKELQGHTAKTQDRLESLRRVTAMSSSAHWPLFREGYYLCQMITKAENETATRFGELRTIRPGSWSQSRLGELWESLNSMMDATPIFSRDPVGILYLITSDDRERLHVSWKPGSELDEDIVHYQ
jgi:hypothetical protein